jgi:hypothetical protein
MADPNAEILEATNKNLPMQVGEALRTQLGLIKPLQDQVAFMAQPGNYPHQVTETNTRSITTDNAPLTPPQA